MDQLFNVIGSAGSGLPAGLGKLPGLEGADLKTIAQQADQLWKMLDDMAESDFDAYKSFIQKQHAALKDEVKRSADPDVEGLEPIMLLEAEAAKHGVVGKAAAVVHIWAAKDCSGVDPVTTLAGPVSTSTSGWAGFCAPLAEYRAPTTTRPGDLEVYRLHVLCHHHTVKLAALGTPAGLRPLLVEAVCQFVEHKYKLVLNRHQRMLQVCRDALNDVELKQLATAQQQQAMQAACAGASSSSTLPPSLVSDLSSMSLPSRAKSSQPSADLASMAASNSSAGANGAMLPGSRPLIVDLSSDSDPAASSHQSDIQVQQVSSDSGQQQIKVSVSRLGVMRAKDVELEMEGSMCFVVTPLAGSQQGKAVRVQLPVAVDMQEVHAKFDPKTLVLTVTLLVC